MLQVRDKSFPTTDLKMRYYVETTVGLSLSFLHAYKWSVLEYSAIIAGQ